MNVLVIGKLPNNILNLIVESKMLDKLYTALEKPYENIPNIEYTSFDDLINKIKALQIDISVTAELSLIDAGLADIFNKNRLNLFAVNRKWLNLETSKIAAKKLMEYYSFNIPATIKAPVTFPVVLKTNMTTIFANTMQELIDKRTAIEESFEKVFLEEFLEGEIAYFTFCWDGKNLLSFSPNTELNEVQQDRFDIFKTKLNFMLSDEKADFLSFFTVKLIWSKNDWYVLDFIMRLNENMVIDNTHTDFLYVLNSAIYQKLNEL